MTTNAQILIEYDANASITSSRLNAVDEQAAQVIAFETLRGLRLSLITVAAYNNLSDANWVIFVGEAANRADDVPGCNIQALSQSEVFGAANLGGNYFEHGYQVIIDGQNPADLTTFRKISS